MENIQGYVAVLCFCVVFFRPTPLILDEFGRTVDASTGEVVEMKSAYVPTLKVSHYFQLEKSIKGICAVFLMIAYEYLLDQNVMQ